MSSISSGTTLTTALVQTADTSGVLQLQTNGGTTAVTIDNSQNVGVGVTPSGWTGGPATQFKYGGSVWNNSDSSFHISENAYFNGSWNYISGTSASATNYFQSTGTHNWRYASAGTGALTWTTGMTLDNSGNLLVGTTSQVSNALTTLASSTARSSLALACTTANQGNNVLYIQKFDNTTTTGTVFVAFAINNGAAGSGQINANGSGAAAFGSYSDSRLKENIADLPSQLSNIMALRPVEFDYIESEGGGHQTGFIAQEMQKVYPDAVGTRQPDGMLTISGWSKTEARLVKAIQELSAQVTTLQTQVTALKG